MNGFNIMINLIKKRFGNSSGCCKIPNTNNGLNNDIQKSYVQQKTYNPK